MIWITSIILSGNAIYHAFSIQFVNFYALHQIYTYPHFLKLVFVCVVIFSMIHFAGMTAILFSGISHVMYLILSTTNWTRILNFKLQSMLIYLDVGFRNSFYIKTLLYRPDSGTLWLFNVFVFFFYICGVLITFSLVRRKRSLITPKNNRLLLCKYANLLIMSW